MEYRGDREKVWIVLSNLFLDTDVTIYYAHIVEQCAKSPFSLNELEAILKSEVAPVCADNLMTVAGVWEGFDEEWLIASIRKNRQFKRGIFSALIQRWKNRCYGDEINEYWLKLMPQIKQLRQQNQN